MLYGFKETVVQEKPVIEWNDDEILLFMPSDIGGYKVLRGDTLKRDPSAVGRILWDWLLAWAAYGPADKWETTTYKKEKGQLP